MKGKIIAMVIVGVALLVGAGVYYAQVYAYYQPVPADDPRAEMRLAPLGGGTPERIPVEDFRGIDADSSPLRFRACFMLPISLATLTETFVIAEGVEPLIAPGWFDCFDAAEIGKALEGGEAVAFIGEKNIEYGIDRIVAVFRDGRAFAWNRINSCGEVVFEGKPAPAGCPPAPN